MLYSYVDPFLAEFLDPAVAKPTNLCLYLFVKSTICAFGFGPILGKTLSKNSRNLSKKSNFLLLYNITDQTVSVSDLTNMLGPKNIAKNS